MTERKQCRLWWPEWLLASEPSSGFLLFGWFMNAGEDVVVAAAVSPSEISPYLQRSELQIRELLHYVNGRMPLPLQESSTFTLLGQCIASCGEGDLKMEHQNMEDLFQRSDDQEKYNESEQSSPSGKAVRASLETAFAENYRKSKCGCKKLDQGLELFRQSSTRCGTWIQLIPQTQRIVFKEYRWVPKFHHIHISGHLLPICDVHVSGSV